MDWFNETGEKGKEGRFLSDEDGEELFAWAKQKLAKFILIGPTLEYRSKIKEFAIEQVNNNDFIVVFQCKS